MLIAPAAAARQWTKGLGSMVALAALFGAVSGLSGALLSAGARGLATGPLIVIAAALLVAFSLLFAPERGLLPAAWRAYRARRDLPQQQVLVDLYRLAVAHQDPHYPIEHGMLTSYYRTDPGAALARLMRQGWIHPLRHMPTEQAHWVLTEAGYQRAAELEGSR
jgi:manganese/zinc/iron transport system permease protein